MRVIASIVGTLGIVGLCAGAALAQPALNDMGDEPLGGGAPFMERDGFGPHHGRRAHHGRFGRRGGHEMRQRMLERFDADEDGQLSDSEREAARDAMEARREEMRARLLERFDADGDGLLNADERAQARAAHRERREAMQARVLERFDADGDGELSREERESMRDEIRSERDRMRVELLEMFDVDGDGELTGEERDAAHEHARSMMRAGRAFRAADTDGDRALSETEIAAATARIAEGDAAMDANGDGAVDASDLRALLEFTPSKR